MTIRSSAAHSRESQRPSSAQRSIGQFFRGEPQRIFAALRCTKELIAFSAAEGAAEHCQSGAVLLFEQRVFDRLDALLSP